jgi:hypothetical protein
MHHVVVNEIENDLDIDADRVYNEFLADDDSNVTDDDTIVIGS